jgi:hypothetical protein
MLNAVGGIAQETTFHVGVIAGVPLTEMLRTYQWGGRYGFAASSGTRRYAVGGMASWDLGRRFAIESGLLYRRFGYDYAAWGVYPPQFAFTEFHGTGASLEVPALLKWNVLHRGSFAPYFAAGATWRRLVGMRETQTMYANLNLNGNPIVVPEGSSDRPETLRHRTAIGPTIAAGVEFRAHHLRFAPEVRYTRWHGDTLGQLGDPLRWNWQRVDFLLAIGF